MALYIGANYHPHDWKRDRWKTDADLMVKAGFTTVRLGHLCWDSYEPGEGVYTFEWFDEVMDLFAAKGINVVLDVSMHPAPLWVHKLCPGCNITGKSGKEQSSLRRYMEDVSDPAYQFYALRFAKTIVDRYKSHPALLAFGLCNELGDGYISYSEYARQRFISWLRKKYHTVHDLNDAWNTQRWSRKLSCFEDVELQENETEIGAPEAWLDMRRFFGDGVADFIVKLQHTIKEASPRIPTASNHYAEKDRLGFDYAKVCEKFVDYPGFGFYPRLDTQNTDILMCVLTTYMHRIAELGAPMWCLEFLTGTRNLYAGHPGTNRMYAFLCLLYRSQMVLGWTWRSMLGGEEQYLFGILDHDGYPGRKYEEFGQIASDFKKLEKYGFPYLPEPEAAVAYSYESMLVCQYASTYYRTPYIDQVAKAVKVLYSGNIDFNVVDLRNLKGNYKLLIVPGHVIMEKSAAEAIRNFVHQGGTVIMTAYSATVDETNTVFETPRPGRLEDVFGIRIAGFSRGSSAGSYLPHRAYKDGSPEDVLKIRKGSACLEVQGDYCEELELKGSGPFATFEGTNLCAVSKHQYGKGYAYYTAMESDEAVLDWLVKAIAPEIGLKLGIEVPHGIQARKIASNQYFYINMTDRDITVPLIENGTGILSEKDYAGTMLLHAYDGELLITSTD